MTESFAGKVALITGGASGIGAALGRELGRQGAIVVLADRQLSLAEAVARDVGRGARAVELDVRDLHAFQALAQGMRDEHGRIDLLFNNAGIGVGGEASTFDAADWDDVMDVNVRGVTNGIVAVYPAMIARGSGHVVNTASMAGLVGTAGEASYAASKHAVVGLSKVLRAEAARSGVRVSVLCPGAIRTPILRGGAYGRMKLALAPEQIDRLWERVRPMDVDDFARASLRDVARNVPFIVHPRWWRVLWWLERASPRASLALWERLARELRREMGSA